MTTETNWGELCTVYEHAVHCSRCLTHITDKFSDEELARLQGELAGFLFRYNELIGYRHYK